MLACLIKGLSDDIGGRHVVCNCIMHDSWDPLPSPPFPLPSPFPSTPIFRHAVPFPPCFFFFFFFLHVGGVLATEENDAKEVG